MSSNNIEFLIYQSQSKPIVTTFKLWINLQCLHVLQQEHSQSKIKENK